MINYIKYTKKSFILSRKMTKRIEKEFKDMTIEEKEAYRNIRFLKLRELHRISEGFRRSIDALIKELDESYLSAKNTGG